MKAAIRDNNPVVVLENELLYVRREGGREGGREGQGSNEGRHPPTTPWWCWRMSCSM